MRRIWILIIILIVAAIFSAQRYYKGNTPQLQTGAPSPTIPLPSAKILPKRTSIFVPYWSVGYAMPTVYDRLIYFGITPTTSGIDTTEPGYQNLPLFASQVPTGSGSLLTLRMLNNTNNFAILENTKVQQKIIAETLSLAKQHGFEGVVLDLEIKALPFESLLKQVNDFVRVFYQEAKKEELSFAVTQYGDTFYRVRPFDVKEVAKNADEVMIMAYDFHKAGGSTPGPNFPLNGREAYGYDFVQMTEGFLKVVPPQKITVIFGYFGYDWPTDEKGVGTNTGAPFSYNEITQQYLMGCDTCVIQRDPVSAETKVTYTSGDSIKHTVWFEDAESIRRKEEYLRSRGVTSYSYWAHTYF